jgi:hypothetical protein
VIECLEVSSGHGVGHGVFGRDVVLLSSAQNSLERAFGRSVPDPGHCLAVSWACLHFPL